MPKSKGKDREFKIKEVGSGDGRSFEEVIYSLSDWYLDIIYHANNSFNYIKNHNTMGKVNLQIDGVINE